MRNPQQAIGMAAVVLSGIIFYGVFPNLPLIIPGALYADVALGVAGAIIMFASWTGQKCPMKGRQFLADPRLQLIRPKRIDRFGHASRVKGKCPLCKQSWTFRVGAQPPLHP